jgi:hypothetical protein
MQIHTANRTGKTHTLNIIEIKLTQNELDAGNASALVNKNIQA